MPSRLVRIQMAIAFIVIMFVLGQALWWATENIVWWFGGAFALVMIGIAHLIDRADKRRIEREWNQ